jgi:hypothetical protein
LEGSITFTVAIDYILIFPIAHVCLFRRRTKHKSTICLTENGRKKIERGEIKHKICPCASNSISSRVILNKNKYPTKDRISLAPANPHSCTTFMFPDFSITASSNKKRSQLSSLKSTKSSNKFSQ